MRGIDGVTAAWWQNKRNGQLSNRMIFFSAFLQLVWEQHIIGQLGMTVASSMIRENIV